MNKDFHYYATYAAAYLSGFSHEASLEIAGGAVFVDLCTKTVLKSINGPRSAATTQSQIEMADMNTDILGLQEITRIWSSFHFLPYDLYASKPGTSKKYLNKYRLICGPNGDLVIDTVNLVKNKSNQAIGLAMHVLADTWAHRYFAGTPSLAINNTNYYFYELLGDTPRQVKFQHNPLNPDNFELGLYTSSVFQPSENSIMNLGHGRAGHLPDYSFMRYKYLPAWGNYEEIIKDNPHDYIHAFAQMITAMKYLNGTLPSFEKEQYDFEAIAPYREEIETILNTIQPDASEDWKAFGEKLSGKEIPPFELEELQKEYLTAVAEEKDNTYLGKFILAALAQKSMVTNKIFKSGNLSAGFSVDYDKFGFKGLKDFAKLLVYREKDEK